MNRDFTPEWDLSEQWEYMAVRFEEPPGDESALELESGKAQLVGNWTDMLDELGGDGWELVATQADVWIFKRPAAEEEEDEDGA